MVVVQFPNAALWLWVVTIVLRRIVETDTAARVLLGWAGLATLGWWSLDELVRGVNPWRRSLGLMGCIIVLAGVVPQLGH